MLEEFKKFLRQKGTIKSQYIPYYAKWVSEDPPLKPADTHNDWTALQEKMRTALRLRQRSYSTEKTYLSIFRLF